MDKKIIQKAGKYFTVEGETQDHSGVNFYSMYQVEIWEKYTGEEQEHGREI
ncbi:MAG: hypothetical protein M9888_06760 [Chitinophagales bacterium]|nr:hypothetical protein [Chitinophagales bacterium]